MNKEIREKLDKYVKFMSDRVMDGITTKADYNSRIYGVLIGLKIAGVITEEETRDLYLEIKK